MQFVLNDQVRRRQRRRQWRTVTGIGRTVKTFVVDALDASEE